MSKELLWLLVWRSLVTGIGYKRPRFSEDQVVVQHNGRALAPVVEHEKMHMMVCAQVELLDIL
jgi:hypothetical protein